MKIPNLFSKTTTQTNLTSGSDGTLVSQTTSSLTATNPPKVEQQIETLVPGQTLQGEVVSKNGNEITLKLAGDMVLTARLERELNLELGKILTFQVKNNGKMLSLSPLFSNMAMESTAGKALDMANIPHSDRTIQMAGLMMEKGMPVDVESIQNVYKDVATFGNATVDHVIRLHQMNIPVTAQTLEQLIQYENLEHQLSMGVSQILSDIQAEGLDQTMLTGLMVSAEESGQVASAPISMVLEPQELQDFATVLKQVLGDMDVSEAVRGFILNPRESSMTVKEVLIFLSEVNLASSETDKPPVTKEQLASSPLSGDESKSVAIDVSNVFADSKADDLILQQSVAGGNGQNGLKDLLQSPFLNKLLSVHFKDQWALHPEQVADKQNVRDVYERLTKQLEGLKQAVMTTGGEESNVFKATTTLQNNLNFMNYMNQMYNYVQIPLNLNGKFSQGELYVYSNKKNLAKADGSVSALLHLDMEHLGPVDVYVAMQNQNVTTNFYLETDELLDFIHAHIHILDERLAKRGYSLSAKMMVREEDAEGKTAMNVMEKIQEEAPEKLVLSHYAFDVRA